MTTELIARAEAVLEVVTEGPWEHEGPTWNTSIWSSAENRVCFMAHSSGLNDDRDIATARFIAASRQLVPDLIAAMKAAEARIEALEAELAAERERAWRLVEALTPSGGTKVAYHGEFSFDRIEVDEDDNEVSVRQYVPWATIKEIMKAIRHRAAYEATP